MATANSIPVNTCRICKNSKGNVCYVAREMAYGLKDEFTYFECAQCHCLQIQELPSEMTRYYPDNYYSFSEYSGRKFKGALGRLNRLKYSSLIFGTNAIQKIAGSFTGINDFYIFDGLGVHKKSRILDIGCGNGQSFLYPLAEIGFTNLKGCDPYLKGPIAYPNGLQIDNTKVNEVSGAWDIITYHHSFEHIDNPIENLEKIFTLLAPEGVCIIRIPTVSSFAWEHYKTNWVQLDAPRHFFLHSIKSMQTLGEITGLELYKTVYDSNYFQFAGSENYLKHISFITPRPKGLMNLIKRKIKKHQYTKQAKQLNAEGRGDQAAFFFRKRKVVVLPDPISQRKSNK